MKTMIKAAFVVASITAGVAMADAPKKPDVTKPATDAKAGSGSGSASKTPATDSKAGSGSGSATKTPTKAGK
jgi:hypothetical protein